MWGATIFAGGLHWVTGTARMTALLTMAIVGVAALPGCILAPYVVKPTVVGGDPGCRFRQIENEAVCVHYTKAANCKSYNWLPDAPDPYHGNCFGYECAGIGEPSPPSPYLGTKKNCYLVEFWERPPTEDWLALSEPLAGRFERHVEGPESSSASGARSGAGVDATPLKQSFAADAITITEFALPRSGVLPGPIVAAGQNLVFSSIASPCTGPCDIYQMDTAGAVTALGVTCTDPSRCRHTGLAPTGDGGFCYTTVNDRYPAGAPYNGGSKPDTIVCKTPTGEYVHGLEVLSGFVTGLALGADGRMWFTDTVWNGIGRLDIRDTEKVRFKYVSSNFVGYAAIAGAPDGSMWFTIVNTGRLGRISQQGLQTYPLPTAFSDPAGITAGPDGNIWFTESKANKIGKITPNGVVTEYPIPTANAGPLGIAPGPDGALWFTEYTGNKIGRITVFGEITEYPIATANSHPSGIVAGPDGNIWFTQTNTSKIGRVNLPSAGLQSVVEFYNTLLDNYFITANPAEQAAIDGGSAGPGWIRTGSVFASGGSSTVCRFYGSISPGPNSHFYTADPDECAALKQAQATTPASQKRWNFESNDFSTTRSVNGACPTGLTPVYRAYNNGFARGVDSNHRISPSANAIADVVRRGWINEGVVMCAP